MIRVPSVDVELDDPALELYLFAKKKEEKQSTGRKIVAGAGLGALALGTMAAIKGRPWLRMSLRRATSKKPDHGKDLSDYIEGSQKATNEGFLGRVIGKHLANKDKKLAKMAEPRSAYRMKAIAKLRRKGVPIKEAKARVDGKLGFRRFGISHYRRFRSGHREALKHYDWEAGLSAAKRGRGKKAWSWKENKVVGGDGYGTRVLKKGRKKLEGDHGIIQKHLNSGMNEREAIRKALTTKDPDIQKYTKYMVASKSGATKSKIPILGTLKGENAYAKYQMLAGLMGPGTMVAGGATYAAAKYKGKKKKNARRK